MNVFCTSEVRLRPNMSFPLSIGLILRATGLSFGMNSSTRHHMLQAAEWARCIMLCELCFVGAHKPLPAYARPHALPSGANAVLEES